MTGRGRVRRAGAAAVVAALIGVLTGCAEGDPLLPEQKIGKRGEIINAASDMPARVALDATFRQFTKEKGRRIWVVVGPAEDVATQVKHGRPLDAVVLPVGPQLDRVRDELAGAPVPLGALGGVEYALAPVTGVALPLTEYLSSARGRVVLGRLAPFQGAGTQSPTAVTPG